MFLNTCLQGGPFAALTGGVSSLHEKFNDHYISRIDALVEFIKDYDADVLCFSEVHDLYAMERLEKLLRNDGYGNFIRHFPTHPVFTNSGLFVASKDEIIDPRFTATSLKNRSNVHLGAELGCMYFDLVVNDKIVTIASTHLNFGEREIDEKSRVCQLKEILQNLFENNSSFLLGGDFNCLYKQDRAVKKIINKNKLIDLIPDETVTTRVTFQEKHSIRKKVKEQEVIDAALLYNKEDQSFTCAAEVITPILEDSYITDHYAILVTLQVSE